ncbi:hypothetical protein ABW20_dc0108003 [Dactylellina cionopaga]|nr:hypothetical protein ABW20_dc0108003 [Dactylellina cionopaga]
MNDDNTYKERVFVINRYDWGYYDRRLLGEIGEGLEEGRNDVLANSNSAGLVDYIEAKKQVQEWKELRPSERKHTEAGVWMYSPHAEYMFGRFGFNEKRTAAHSFLFFSSNTVFTRTTFRGLGKPVRKEETHEERFERRLNEGYDFSGLKDLYQLAVLMTDSTVVQPSPLSPPKSELLGPYSKDSIILKSQDIDSIAARQLQPQPSDASAPSQSSNNAVELAGLWRDRVHNLINELVSTYLERFVIPAALQNDTVDSMAKALFPRHSDTRSTALDRHTYRHFIQQREIPIEGLDDYGVKGRIKEFLASRSPDIPVLFDDDYGCLAGLCRVITYLVSEVLELANNRAMDSYRRQIMPCDIRIAVYFDKDLIKIFQHSRVFWDGEI